jgi:crotonobetaine/carnitine-CoA ligase
VSRASAPDTLGRVLAEQAERLGDRAFLTCAGRQWSYWAMNEIACRVANGLAARGVGKGTVVGLMMPNVPEFLITWFALSKLGAVEAPVNTALRGQSLVHVLGDIGARTLIAGREYLEEIARVAEHVPSIAEVIVFDRHDAGAVPSGFPFPAVPFAELLEGPAREPDVEVGSQDVMAIMHTSGTTGLSKGVMLCHRHQFVLARNVTTHVGMTGDDVVFSCLPYFHNMAQALLAYPALQVGARVAMVERFSANHFWREVRESASTVLIFIGSMLAILLKQPAGPDEGSHHLRVGFGVPVPADVYRDFRARFGVELVGGYGSTEASMVAFTPPGNPRPESAGRILPSDDVRSVDAEDREVPRGVMGELVLRPREPWITFLGYHGQPEATAAAWRNLYFHTGDAAVIDEDGFLHFRDRIKDVIRRRGENISSVEVESVVNLHPSVLTSAAFAVPSDVGEDEVKVVFVLREGAGLDPAALLAHCEEHLPYFAVPRYVEVRPALPLTPTQRVEKRTLRDEGITPATWDREAAGYRLRRTTGVAR